MDLELLKLAVESHLDKKLKSFALFAQGMVNFAYLAETENERYIVKVERLDKETDEQNDLVVEGNLLILLNEKDASFSVPHLCFVANDPKMYAYEFIEGDRLIDAWPLLSEEKRIELCKSLGYFHAKLGKLVNLEEACNLGLVIDTQPVLSDELREKYDRFINDEGMPDSWKDIAQLAEKIYVETQNEAKFQCIHNDAHNENIIVKDGALLSFVDFGDCEYADIHREFSFYVRQYPDCFKYVVGAYIEASGNNLSEKRIISFALMRDLDEIAYYFHNPEKETERLEKLAGIPVQKRMINYQRLLKPFLV